MANERNFELTTVDRAKASVKKAQVATRAIRRIQRLTGELLASKTTADLKSSIAALCIALQGFE
jgi:hypothetical protein